MKYLALAAAVLMSAPALAADMTIEMLNKDADGNKMVYSEEIARVDVGDTITWVPTTKGHKVQIAKAKAMGKSKKKLKKLLGDL